MSAWSDLRADLGRYPRRAWVREQSVWAVAVYRFGRWGEEQDGLTRIVAGRAYWFAFRVLETLLGIGISKNVIIGPGLRIHHFGGIFVADGVRIGRDCTLRQGVTIGNRVEDGPVPVLGDGVDLGAYAQVLGGVTLGDGCRVGALSVIVHDVPPGATAVGLPARVGPDRRAARDGADLDPDLDSELGR
jgi:serine O-acetyltransferase